MKQDKKEQTTAGLGTFGGVFTPSILTILGIILFLRLGFVVGSAGILKALLMIGIANLISLLTSFSLAAIATNMKVKGGGDYYLISRTLGIEFGGAIGIVLFLAQSVSIAFYCIGFGESVSLIAGSGTGGYSAQFIAGTALVFLFVLAWIGADFATKFQYVVMTFLVLALVSFYIGGIGKFQPQLFARNLSSAGSGMGFWPLFAIFFPAVTGFTQGVSMSGDLKDPGSSLPRGTFAAVILSIFVYFSVAVVFAGSSSLFDLSTDYGIMKKTAWTGWLIDAGVIAATLSSAMASFLGAPRILQSLAGDRIFPFLNIFEKGHGQTNNPRRAVLLSLIIALLTIVLGELDLIAGIVSMFFLISYGLLNYATYYEASAESPSFRPRFRWYNKRLSLAGFWACLIVMLAIDYKTGIASAAVLFAVFQYLKRTAMPARWADSRRSHHLKKIREHLIAADKEVEHSREWRPFIIALSDDIQDMDDLLDFAVLLEGNSGMTTAAKIIEGTGYRAIKNRQSAEKELKLRINEKGRNVFPLAVRADETDIGLPVLFQSYGIGPVKANTVMISWQPSGDDTDDPERAFDYSLYVRSALQNGCNVIMLDKKAADSEPGSGDREKTIDVWWKGDDTSRLMILLAYLVTRHPDWEDSEIRLLAFTMDDDSKGNLEDLSKMLEEIRIDAVPEIIKDIDETIILEKSSSSDLVFLPVFLKDSEPYVVKDVPAKRIVPGIKKAALTMAAQKVDLAADPEQGKQAELAIILDELRHAEKRAASSEKMALQANQDAIAMMESVNIEESLASKRALNDLKNALASRETAQKARRKAQVERTKLMEITKKAREEGIQLETETPSKK